MDERNDPHTEVAPNLRLIEEAGLNAMQTQRQLFYDGWLVRLSPGKAKRARSVNAFFGSTLPLAAKVAHCTELFDDAGLPLLFRITPFDAPADLDAQLEKLGFVAFDTTLVQVASLCRPPEIPALAEGVMLTFPEADEFVTAVGNMRGSTSTEREAHAERMRNALAHRRGVVVWMDRQPVCAGQVSLHGGYAGIFDVVTADRARGQGFASSACALLLCWAWDHGARWTFLQVDSANAPALAVYRKFGYETAYTYHYRGRPGALR
jgi:RimJ/RimL family protein N-acetyltransferase